MSEVQADVPGNYPGPRGDLGGSLVHAGFAVPRTARSSFARGYIRACKGHWR
jgi:hypothetical protein